MTLEPGCYIDSHWGHYQSVRVIELAQSFGYRDQEVDDTWLATIIQAYEEGDSELEVMRRDGVTYLLSDNGFTITEWVYETAEDATNFINDHDHLLPEGYWFGHHPDLGDVGVWEHDDE